MKTFWVKADVMGENGNIDEAFHYNKITHTGAVDTNAIPILISGGKITLDYLLWKNHLAGKFISRIKLGMIISGKLNQKIEFIV